jgi:hypothetical protein
MLSLGLAVLRVAICVAVLHGGRSENLHTHHR